jgi:hypothetical protein
MRVQEFWSNEYCSAVVDSFFTVVENDCFRYRLASPRSQIRCKI